MAWRLVVVNLDLLDAGALAALDAATVVQRAVKDGAYVAKRDEVDRDDRFRDKSDEKRDIEVGRQFLENAGLARGTEAPQGFEWNYHLRRTGTTDAAAIKMGFDALKALPDLVGAPPAAPPVDKIEREV